MYLSILLLLCSNRIKKRLVCCVSYKFEYNDSRGEFMYCKDIRIALGLRNLYSEIQSSEPLWRRLTKISKYSFHRGFSFLTFQFFFQLSYRSKYRRTRTRTQQTGDMKGTTLTKLQSGVKGSAPSTNGIISRTRKIDTWAGRFVLFVT